MVRLIFAILFATLFLSPYHVNGARILGFFPIPSISHQVVFRALMYKLAARGHEIVMVTPNPGLPKDRPKDNITEIDTSVTYEAMAKFFKRPQLKRGCVHLPDEKDPTDIVNMIEMLEQIFQLPNVKGLLEDKTQKFDLVVVEAMFSSIVVLGKYYNAPVIWFSSFYGISVNYEAVGAPSTHPILSPDIFRTRLFNLSLWEKLQQSYSHFLMKRHINKALPHELNLVKKYFKDFPDITTKELWSRVDLLFLNAHPVFEGNRPVPPNVIYLGGLHMQPRKQLPQDLKTYLDNSKRGVVYFSLGTNVHFSLMDKDLVETFVNAVEALPYDVLWKIEEKYLPRKPKNARTEKWFPQRDLLHHPNVKAFITQGGLQSADETIDAGVPVVILPMLGDQWYNSEQYERLGVGIKLDVLTLETEELVEAVKTVIKDKSYRQNMTKLSSIIRDQPETSLERAVWWSEYLIRHGGSKHLRSLSANVSWLEYLMLDVVGVILAALVAALGVTVAVVKLVLSLVFGSKTGAKKVKQN